jgi:hypothetical protein
MSADFDLTAWCRSRYWWQAADDLARAGHSVVVHDPEAPREYRDTRHSGILTYHVAGTGFAAGHGVICVVRGKRTDVTIRIVERRTDVR